MKPKRIKKTKHRFVADIDKKIFDAANAERVKHGHTWPSVIEHALTAIFLSETKKEKK